MSRYGELVDLYAYGAPSAAFGSLTDPQRIAGLEAASAEFDAAARAIGQLPLVTWDLVVTQKVCAIAAYELIARVGFNPAMGSDQNYLLRAQEARAWIKAVSRSELHPGVTFTTSPNARAQPRARSKPLRGWNC